MKDVANPTSVNAAMKIAFSLVLVNSPPGFRTNNHMLKQNPPRRQPSPSVISVKVIAAPPRISPVMAIATTYAPWIALLTGGFITYSMSTVTARLARYAAEKYICSHLFLIPTSV